MKFKSYIKSVFPRAYRYYLSKRYQLLDQKDFLGKTNEQIFSRIYKEGKWGSGGFNSGIGSNTKSLMFSYVEFVSNFITSRGDCCTIVDLGCGDFNVGSNFVNLCQRYVGCDVVKELIEYNRENFTAENLEFVHCDIVHDEIPHGDIVFVRQVFQHLSNEQIITVLKKLESYPYVIITEHVPTGNYVPNIDKPPGPDTRILKNSGVNIFCDPFRVFDWILLDELVVQDIDYGVLRTVIVQQTNIA